MLSIVEIVSSSWFGNLASALGPILAFVGFFFLAYRRWITRENLKNIAVAFNDTVRGLASDKIEDRLSSAIVLRRFFDKGTEYGVGGAPFAQTAVSVISAMLKHAHTSNFQKVLADSLAHAPKNSLRFGDFQRANLSKAYLGGVNFEAADFFQSNLTGASLKGALLERTVFRESYLDRTVFKGARLNGANFDMATLQNIDFEGADLRNSSFRGSILRDVDFTGAQLDGAIFENISGFGVIGACKFNTEILMVPRKKIIFISRSGQLDNRQSLYLEGVKAILKRFDFDCLEIGRGSYDTADVLSNLNKKISECVGMIAFGFQSIIVNDGLFRLSTVDSKRYSNIHLSTPWIHVEIAMAVALNRPILALTDGAVEDGVFSSDVNDRLLTKQDIELCLNADDGCLNSWLSALCDGS